MAESNLMRFERVWSDYGGALGRVVSAYARPGADHDDLAQEIAFALLGALPRFRGESSEKTFVLRVAHNRGLKHALERQPLAEPPETADPAPGPDEALERTRQIERLFQAIRQLPLGQREVLALALEELSHDEIATILGITANNVGVRLSRARDTLKTLLMEDRS